MTPSQFAWHAAYCPPHGYPVDEACGAACATCGQRIGRGVPLHAIETPTTANHADYFRFGSRHVCYACAWLFAAGKGRPGNYVAANGRLEYTVISQDSVVADKRPWSRVLPELAALPAETPVAGVMTTDVKPRLWPRTRMATIGAFGLYVHAPDYDVSEWRAFGLAACLECIALMRPPLAAGYAKASLWHSLLRDHARASRAPEQALAWDAALRPHRGQPHYLPALIAAGIAKGGR